VFVDQAKLHARAGDGGAGAVSFRREAHVERGGPDGGDGGKGGDVYVEADPQLSSLLSFRDHPFRRAEDGRHGQGGRRHGASGADCIVALPVGTVVRDRDGTIVADLCEPGLRVLVARGGRGGAGNARFLSNRRRAPGFAEQGEPGEELWLDLELKLAADVALVGQPNVGKSSLVAAMSNARPKIGDYPFTTLVPTLGVVRGPEGSDFVLADIPGLIEGASEGRGLGHAFLRHVERARVLALVVPLDDEDGAARIVQVHAELERYLPALAGRPRVLVGTRCDLVSEAVGRARAEAAAAAVGVPLAGIVSSTQRRGLGELARRLAGEVAKARAEAATAPVTVVLRPQPRYEYQVTRRQGGFVVEGRDALRAVAFSDLTLPETLAIAEARLRRMGVMRRLRRLGAREGDPVWIGAHSFTYHEDS
jgi:GTP-binding protein